MNKAAVLVALLLFSGCSPFPQATPNFNVGDIVCFKIKPDLKGMLTYRYCGELWCEYDIRIARDSSVTDTRILSHDRSIKELPVTLVENVRDIELQRCSPS